MKNALSTAKLLLLAAVTVFTVSSCKKDNNSIVGVASGDANFSILVDALERAGLTAALDGETDYTVFAPTNAAFTTFLAANGFASIDDVPVATLTQILLNHVVAGHVHSDDLVTGYINTEATYNNEASKKLSLYVDLTSGVRLNGVSSVVTPDIAADNGVIHSVDAVIGLPTIVTHAVANPNFSSLVSAVVRNDYPSGSNYATILSGAGPYTVFAPTDAAFNALVAALGLPNLAAAPSATVEPILLYHVVSGNVRAGDLTNNQVVTTLNPATFTVLIGTGVSLDTGNATNPNVVATDVQCVNGVIHVVDQVLLP